MEKTSILSKATLRWPAGILLLLAFFYTGLPVFGQTPVTGVYTHFVNATTGVSYTGQRATGNSTAAVSVATYTYLFGNRGATSKNTELLDSFVVTGLIFKFFPTTPTVKFKRVNNSSVTGQRSSLWFQENTATQTTTTITSAYPYDDVMEHLFAGRNFNAGIDNNFQNATSTNNNNVERVDVIFPMGITATTDLTRLGFVVFDRGAGGGHDPFKIAAIASLDVNGDPASYFTSVSAASTNYGDIDSTSMPFNIFRKNTGETLLLETLNSAQQRDGVFFTFSALHIPAFTTKVYGYSLFSTDANTGSSADMVNYNNFPTTTDLTNGGLDQVAVTGVAYTDIKYITLDEKLEHFSAAPAANGQVQVSWSQQTNNDLKQEILERSGNGVDFSPLQRWYPPFGGQEMFVDMTPLPGDNYYRLSLVNMDDEVAAYSAVSRVNMGQTAVVSLHIFPNPVMNKRFMLEGQGLKNEVYNIRVFDRSGNLMALQKLTGAPVFSGDVVLPASLATGVYTIELMDKNGIRVLVKDCMVQ